MNEIKLPDPDTHCWDDDSSQDVWSYSPDLVRQIIEADRVGRDPLRIKMMVKRREQSQHGKP